MEEGKKSPENIDLFPSDGTFRVAVKIFSLSLNQTDFQTFANEGQKRMSKCEWNELENGLGEKTQKGG